VNTSFKKNNSKTIIFLSMAAVFMLFTSCLKDKTIPLGDCNSIISYDAEIRPIIESSCKTQAGGGTGCHDAWIDEYDGIKGNIDAGIWQNEIFTDMTMPVVPNNWGIDSLSQDEITTMKCWINQGYPEN
jgi:hypothetical protein